ncbi:MAG: Crp/Fnr family transcriptional regulator [Aliihoeflea sp.]
MMQSTNLLIRKLESFHELSKEDRDLLDLHTRPVKEIPAKRDIVQEGDRPTDVTLILSGFACRYKMIKGGRRQIMAYLVPGDFCDFHIFIFNEMDHSISTLSRCQVVSLSRNDILKLSERPAIARAFWWSALVEAAVLREWLVSIGQRTADERIAHLLCEILVRLRAVGLVKENRYTLPITQTDLADTVGMTVVHANRMLMSLRAAGLIELDGKELTVTDVDGLMRLSGFKANYLHLKA